MSKSRSGWVLYVMVHLPFFWYHKIGITSTHIGAKRRAKAIDRAVRGFPVPVFFVVVPFAWHIEQAVHTILSPLRVRFYRGDGASEWFLFGGIFAIPIFAGIWVAEIWLIKYLVAAV